MSRDLVLIHGRAQERKDSIALKAEWIEAFRQGLAESGLQLPIAETQIRFPYYGDTLDALVREVPADQVPAVIVRSLTQQTDDVGLKAFMVDVLAEVATRKGITDEQIEDAAPKSATAGAEVLERGVLNWGWVQGILTALDSHVPGASGASIAIATRDVYLYLANSGLRKQIDDGVRQAMNTGVESVVVAHSLGTVVAYNLLKREGGQRGWKVPLFVTLGSPLAVKKIKMSMVPNKHPECVKKWYNAMDPDDIVSLYPLDATHFPLDPEIENNVDIDNDTDNQHGISGYLKDKEVAKRIYDSLNQ